MIELKKSIAEALENSETQSVYIILTIFRIDVLNV